MLEAGQAAELAGGDHPAAGRRGLQIQAQELEVVQLIVAPVLQRSVGVDARLVGEGVLPHAGLIDGMGTPKA